MKTEIIKLRKEGKSYNEISEILKCSKGTVSYHCKNLENNKNLQFFNIRKKNIYQTKNITILDFGKEISEKEIKDIILYRTERYSYEKINKITNIPLDKIKKICRVKEINDQNKYSNVKFQRYEFTDNEINEMQLFYNNCNSSRKVAKKFGLTRYVISKYLKINKKTKLDIITLKKNRSNNVVSWRRRTKIKLVEYKGGCCECCGYKKSIGALEFHHKDPSEKDFNISAKAYAFERLKKEVDKCILVCSNCHIEIHEEITNKGYSDIINNLGV